MNLNRFPQSYFRQITAKAKEMPGQHLIRSEMAAEGPAADVEIAKPEIVNHMDLGWLPFAAPVYHISPRIEDYVIMTIPICPSDFPNRNGIGFPLKELVAFQPPPMNRRVFEAWKGCPLHLEHDNEDCTKAYGVVLDTALKRITGYGQDEHWKVMGLIGVDKNKHPDIAQKVLSGELNTGSMGALANDFSCSVCHRPVVANKFLNCNHVSGPGDVNWKLVDYQGKQHIAFLNAHGLSPIEFSLVGSPAWTQALTDQARLW